MNVKIETNGLKIEVLELGEGIEYDNDALLEIVVDKQDWHDGSTTINRKQALSLLVLLQNALLKDDTLE